MVIRKILCPHLRIFRSITTGKTTVDKSEVEVFGNLSSEWWNLNGALKPLHSFNKLRVPFIREGLIQSGTIEEKYINTSHPLKALKILDVGCGGGILSEPLARLGAEVTGLDASSEAIREAKEHCTKKNLSNVSYITSSIENHAVENKEKYDAVIASEILEHVTNKENFIEVCVHCLKPGGAIFVTTMSKTFLAELLGIRMAEFLDIVPKGVHEIDKFIEPHDIRRILEKNRCHVKLIHGMMYVYLTNTWLWTSNTSINYGLYAVKSGDGDDELNMGSVNQKGMCGL